MKKEQNPAKDLTPNPYQIQADEIHNLCVKIAEAKNNFDFAQLNNAQLGLVLATLLEGVDRCYTIKEFRDAINLLKGDHKRTYRREDRYLTVDLLYETYHPRAC